MTHYNTSSGKNQRFAVCLREAYRRTMGIFAVFAYEFEIAILVKSFAYAHGEIIYSVNCEI